MYFCSANSTLMKFNRILYYFIFTITCFSFSGCLWARRCPEKSCHIAVEHKHEGGVYRPRAAFSWTTTKKHWPWTSLSRKSKYNGKKDKKNKKPKFKYLLPGERVNFDKN
jgi:hypothetical protein